MTVTLRPLTREDFPFLARWLDAPHVRRWWRSSADVETHYGPSLDGRDPTQLFIALAGNTPIGMLQAYLVDDYPAHAESVGLPGGVGVDLLIGEPDYIGQGYGPAILRAFIETILPARFPHAPGIIADPSVNNLASIRAFEKAGFVKGKVVVRENGDREQLMVLKLK